MGATSARASASNPGFNPAVALPASAAVTPSAELVNSDGSFYVVGSTGPGTGCALFSLSHNGSAAAFHGRTPGGVQCTASSATLKPSGGLVLTSQTAAGSVVGRSHDSGASFAWSAASGQFAMGSMAADPAPNAAGMSDLYLLVRDVTTGLPRIAISQDGGATFTLGDPLVNAVDIASGQWSGPGPLPLAGTLTARRDATGLHLYGVVETADSAADRAAQAAAKTDNLNRVYAALGTVSASLTPGAPPTVSWHDVEVYHAPAGAGLNHGTPATAVDSAGHVYEAFADGRHTFFKSDLTGAGFNAAAAPLALDSAAAGLPAGLDASVAPALGAGGNGKVDVGWYGATGGGSTPDPSADPKNNWTVLMAQTVDGGATWLAGTASPSTVHTGPAPGALQLAVDQVGGVAAVAYQADAATPGTPSLFATRQCTGLSAVTGNALVDDCVAPQPATASVLPGSTCPGPQVRDAAGDALDTSAAGAGGSVPELDILLAQFNAVDPATQVATITLNQASTTLPADMSAATWRLTWTQGTAQRYAQAVLKAGAVPVFTTGLVNSDGTLAAGTAVQGAINPGANGTITMTLPLATIGAPANGASLQNLAATSYALYSATPALGSVLIDRAPDAGSGAAFAVGQVCAPSTDAPEVPAGALLPIVGGAALGFAAYRRRSRRHTQ
ncbi:MAG: hypothetical protein JOZ46_03085 [Candidatus Dormibacteraeota bacterium]|nr:hypothetical protein [Candidatus Dormibacteraeota bacterium]MBV9524784.1 hypothetical protein [Candidatus Dormibacteraeota bacterium]